MLRHLKQIYERSYNYLNCREQYKDQDPCSYTRNLSSCEIKALACEQALCLGLTREVLSLTRDLFWTRAATQNLLRETQKDSLLAG